MTEAPAVCNRCGNGTARLRCPRCTELLCEECAPDGRCPDCHETCRRTSGTDGRVTPRKVRKAQTQDVVQKYPDAVAWGVCLGIAPFGPVGGVIIGLILMQSQDMARRVTGRTALTTGVVLLGAAALYVVAKFVNP